MMRFLQDLKKKKHFYYFKLHLKIVCCKIIKFSMFIYKTFKL